MSEVNSIEALRSNINYKKSILKEVSIFLNYLETITNLERRGFKTKKTEKELLYETVNSLMYQLRILNDSVPDLVKNISFFKELPVKSPERKITIGREKLVSLEYKKPSVEEKKSRVIVKKDDKMKFLKELSFTANSVKRLKREYKIVVEKVDDFKKPSLYARTSNKFFLNLSADLFEKGYFKGLNSELRKANLYFLSQTYVSMAFFSSFIAIFASIGLLILLLFFNLSFEFPFLVPATESIFLRFLKTFWIVIVLPILTFFAFYFYPLTEKKSIASRINQELPFAVIHMSAIAGSGIEPTKIFKIIVISKEYPNTRREVKKLLNEINIYGYDLVTALRNISKMTSSAKLAELFKGMATTITSGGSLKEFLDKRAETLIFDYRIEREKYTRMAETFMDIYISVVISAPMIMTMLLVMISLTGMSFGLSLDALTLLMVLGISLINIFFLVFLHLRQPNI